MQLACPHCNAINRVNPDRLADRPICGQCKEALFTGTPIELTRRNFDRHLAHSGLPLLIDFWAPWCAPCRTMTPVIAQAAREFETTLRVAKLNTEAEGEIASRLVIRSIPTLAVFQGGREIARQAGAVSFPVLSTWVREALAAQR
jgi:thioredoxin 2